MNRLFVLAMISILALSISACEQKGPAEKAGESIDEAVENIKDGGEDIGDAIKDTCEEIKEGAGAKDTDC